MQIPITYFFPVFLRTFPICNLLADFQDNSLLLLAHRKTVNNLRAIADGDVRDGLGIRWIYDVETIPSLKNLEGGLLSTKCAEKAKPSAKFSAETRRRSPKSRDMHKTQETHDG